MTINIEAAIAKIELGMESTGTGTFHYHRMAEALALLRSLPGPATEEEVWKLADEGQSALTRMENWYQGFRAAEEFHGVKK